MIGVNWNKSIVNISFKSYKNLKVGGVLMKYIGSELQDRMRMTEPWSF